MHLLLIVQKTHNMICKSKLQFGASTDALTSDSELSNENQLRHFT